MHLRKASTFQNPQKPSYFGRLIWGSVLGGSLYWLGRPTAKYPTVEGPGFVRQCLDRSRSKLVDFFYGFQEPAFQKFLPDRQPPDPQHPARSLTLVIDLDHFLVTHFWDPRQGKWRVAKRPGADVFLFYMAQAYEVVLFSSMNQQEGEMIMQKLDPYGCVSYRLYRFATTFEKGEYHKDLSKLNRDLSQVVAFGPDAVGYSRHAENFLHINAWDGGTQDSLLSYVDFFEALAASKTTDVRSIVRKYQSHDVAERYSQHQKDLYNKIRDQQLAQMKSRSSNWFFRLFSLSANRLPDSSLSIPTFEEKRSMLLELRLKEYANAKRLMDEQIEKERKRHEEEARESKLTMWDVAVNGASTQPSSATAV